MPFEAGRPRQKKSEPRANQKNRARGRGREKRLFVASRFREVLLKFPFSFVFVFFPVTGGCFSLESIAKHGLPLVDWGHALSAVVGFHCSCSQELGGKGWLAADLFFLSLSLSLSLGFVSQGALIQPLRPHFGKLVAGFPTCRRR